MPPTGRPKLLKMLEKQIADGAEDENSDLEMSNEGTPKDSGGGNKVSDVEAGTAEESSVDDPANKSTGGGKRGRSPDLKSVSVEKAKKKKKTRKGSRSTTGKAFGRGDAAKAKKDRRNERQRKGRDEETAANLDAKSRHYGLVIHRVISDGILKHLKFLPDYWTEYYTYETEGSPCRYLLSSEVGKLMGTSPESWKLITKYSKDFIRNWRNNLYNKLKLRFTREFV